MPNAAVTVTHSQDEGMQVPEPGLRRQVMSFTPDMMLVRHRMDKGWKGVRHQHPHEQLVYVVSGSLMFETEAGQVAIQAGDSLIVAGGVDHQAWALEDSEVLDVFTPYREEYAPKGLI